MRGSCARVCALVAVGHQVESAGAVKFDAQAAADVDEPRVGPQGFLQQGGRQGQPGMLERFVRSLFPGATDSDARNMMGELRSGMSAADERNLERMLAGSSDGVGTGTKISGGLSLPDPAALEEAARWRARMEDVDGTLFLPSSPVTESRWRMARLAFGHNVASLRAPVPSMAEEDIEKARAANQAALEEALKKIKVEAAKKGLPPTNWDTQSSREVRDGPEVLTLKALEFQLAWLKGQQETVAAAATSDIEGGGGAAPSAATAAAGSSSAEAAVSAGGDVSSGTEAAPAAENAASSRPPGKVMIFLEQNGYDPAKRGSIEFADLVPVALAKGIDVIVPWILPDYVDESGEKLAQLLDAAIFVLGLTSDAVDLNLVVADAMSAPMAKALPQMQSKFASLVFMNPTAAVSSGEAAAMEEERGGGAQAASLQSALADTPTLLMQGLMAAVEVGEAQKSDSDAALSITDALEKWLTNVGAFYGSQFALQLRQARNEHAPFNAIGSHELLNQKWLWNFNAATESGEIDKLHNLMMVHPAARNMYRAAESAHQITAFVKREAQKNDLVQSTEVETLVVDKSAASWARLAIAGQVANWLDTKMVPSQAFGGHAAPAAEEETSSSCECGAAGAEESKDGDSSCCAGEEEPSASAAASGTPAAESGEESRTCAGEKGGKASAGKEETTNCGGEKEERQGAAAPAGASGSSRSAAPPAHASAAGATAATAQATVQEAAGGSSTMSSLPPMGK